MENLFSIKNKVILITGAGKGIGNLLASEMWKSFAIIYAIDKIFSKNLNTKENYYKINCDVTDRKKIFAICKQIFEKHKRIDVLINNAGITLPQHGKDYPYDKWEKTINVNLTGPFICSQAVTKFMKKQKFGSIINITSINAELAFPNNPAYVASKGGLKMLGKAFAKDCGKYGIRVNNIGPGYIKTDMTMKSFLNKKMKKIREERTVLGRWGDVKDLIGPTIFLASDASKYITGQDIYVDGGWTINGLSESLNLTIEE